MNNITGLLNSAFADKPVLKRRLEECISESPQYTDLVLDVSTYVSELRQSASSSLVAEPAAKKRKLEGAAAAGGAAAKAQPGAWDDPAAQAVYSAPGVSFSIPQRGKLTLQVVGGREGGIRAVDASGKSDAPYEFGLSWRDVDQVFCLPVPDKQKRAWNYIVVPKGNDGIAAAADAGAREQLLWTYSELSPKEAAASTAPPEPDHTLTLLEKQLAPFGKTVTTPNDDEFASATPQLHRKGEKAYHVKAFRGSKEGYLFFLPTGILWGFKKPITFFAFGSIESISYTSVLQRTFNLVVATNPRREGDAGQEIEFSMLDQPDFAGIDAYVKSHGLNDASLAKARAAKLYNVNKDKTAKGTENGEGGAEANGEVKTEEDDGLTELQRAEQQAQDEEDEMEEDYDPGSEGESEGEGSSEDEGYDDAEGGGEVEPGEEVEGEYEEEGEEEEEEYDEEEPEEAPAPGAPPVVSGGFAVINSHGRAPPDEPEDGFL